nr:unnamed protein product [Callosobruchus analis]
MLHKASQPQPHYAPANADFFDIVHEQTRTKGVTMRTKMFQVTITRRTSRGTPKRRGNWPRWVPRNTDLRRATKTTTTKRRNRRARPNPNTRTSPDNPTTQSTKGPCRTYSRRVANTSLRRSDRANAAQSTNQT